MRLISRWRSIAGSAGIALAFAAAVAAGAFAIVAGLAPAPTPTVPAREALLIESAPSQPTLSLEPYARRVTAPVRTPLPSVAVKPPPREAVPARRAATLEAVDPGTDPIDAAPPARPPEPIRRNAPRTDVAALPSDPAPAPVPPQRTVLEPPRLTHPPVLRPRPDPRMEGVLTPDEIRRIRTSLRLTAEQMPHWPPVEALLQEIGAQQVALVKAGQKAEDAFGSGLSMRIYWAARPLLGVLREDQKARIRARAKALGLDAVASAI